MKMFNKIISDIIKALRYHRESDNVELKRNITLSLNNYLIENENYIVEQDPHSESTFLIYSILNGHENVALFLLNNPNIHININIPDSDGKTALFYAIFRHPNLAFEILKMPDLDINFRDSNGNSALWYAIWHYNEKIALEILNMPNVDIMKYCSINNKYVSPLIDACRSGLYNVVLRLLELGVNPMEEDNTANRSVPLDVAIYNNRKDIVILLLEYGVDANKQDSYGYTPLMIACLNGHFEIVNILLNHGVKLESKNNYRMNAFSLAKNDKIRDLLELIKD